MGDRSSGKSTSSTGEQIIRIPTHYQKHNVSGMAVYDKHVFVLHWTHNTLYVYSKRGLLAKADIPDLTLPWGMALMGSGANKQLVIGDGKHPYGLHWVSVSMQGGQCVVGSTRKQKLSFLPWGVFVDDTINTLMVADPMNQKIQLYHSGKKPSVVSVSPSVMNMPHHVVPSRPKGGLVICDNKTQLTWLNEKGDVLHNVKQCKNLVNPCHMITDKKGHVVVADYDGHSVVVYKNGSYACHLLKETDGIHCPTRLVLDEESSKLWVSHGKQDTGFELICLDFPDSFDVAVTNC